MMSESKNADRYLILLEDMNTKLEVVAEGYDQLNHKIDTVESSLKLEIKAVRTDLRAEIRLICERMDKIEHHICLNS